MSTENRSDTEPSKAEPSHRQTAKGVIIGIAISTMVAFLGALFLRMNKDELPAPQAAAVATTFEAAGDANNAHGDIAPLAPEIAARVAELETTLGSNPGDLNARKQLAVLLVQADQYMPAFRQAETILESFPDDPDGLYVHGVVRLRMGQTQMAIDLLDRLLVAHPSHVGGLMAKGMAFLRIGNTAAAVTTWEKGLAAAGGKHAELERLLRVSRAAGEEPGQTTASRATSAGEPSLPGLAPANQANSTNQASPPPPHQNDDLKAFLVKKAPAKNGTGSN